MDKRPIVLSDTLIEGEVGIEPVNIPHVIDRIASMAAWLEAHETFVSYLGVGTVMITRLPNSFCVEIEWNESQSSVTSVYLQINSQQQSGVYTMYLQGILSKYLKPILDDEVTI